MLLRAAINLSSSFWSAADRIRKLTLRGQCGTVRCHAVLNKKKYFLASKLRRIMVTKGFQVLSHFSRKKNPLLKFWVMNWSVMDQFIMSLRGRCRTVNYHPLLKYNKLNSFSGVETDQNDGGQKDSWFCRTSVQKIALVCWRFESWVGLNRSKSDRFIMLILRGRYATVNYHFLFFYNTKKNLFWGGNWPESCWNHAKSIVTFSGNCNIW